MVWLTSCEYKELCYDHSHSVQVKVAFDWTLSPEAQADGMTVLFYNLDDPTTEPERYDYPGMEGGTATLYGGNWMAVAYNYDTETILYRDMQDPTTLEAYTRFSTLEESTQISTRSSMPVARGTEDEPIILEPDMLWGGATAKFTLDGSNKEQVITIRPEKRVKEVTIDIHNVPNLQYTGQFGGSLSGLSPSVLMQSGVISNDCVIEAFTLNVVGESTLQMSFRIFGHCPHFKEDGDFNRHLLTIYAVLADGQQWYYTTDVTEQMHDPVQNPDEYHVYLNIENLPIPKPIVNGSGFQPTIDGWQGEDITVGM